MSDTKNLIITVPTELYTDLVEGSGIGYILNTYRQEIETALNNHVLVKDEKWIPVTERLPKERKTYEVTLQGVGELEGIDNEVAYATWLGNKNNRENNWLYHDVNNWKDKEVIAWKPRSKPYKAESERK